MRVDKGCVLIIGGSQSFYEQACATLYEYGFSPVSCAADGEIAFEAIRSYKPQMVILCTPEPELEAALLRKLDYCGMNKPVFVVMSMLDRLDALHRADGYSVQRVAAVLADPDALAVRAENLICGVTDAVPGIDSPRTSRLNLEQAVCQTLMDAGVPTYAQGYRYLRVGILLGLQSPEILRSVTKELYPRIAELCGATPTGVERSIRNAINRAWTQSSSNLLNTCFACASRSNRRRPTNREFICAITEMLRVNMTR